MVAGIARHRGYHLLPGNDAIRRSIGPRIRGHQPFYRLQVRQPYIPQPRVIPPYPCCWCIQSPASSYSFAPVLLMLRVLSCKMPIRRQPPLNGNILNMVKMPVGWIGLGLDGISIIVYIIYGQWAKHQGNKVLKSQDTIASSHAAAAAPDFTNVESALDGAKSPAVAGGIYTSQPEGVPTPPLAESATLPAAEGASG
jgi:hypothetical protein